MTARNRDAPYEVLLLGGFVIAVGIGIAAFLRHKSPGTTSAYLHPTMDDLSAALEVLPDG